ncbi:MAG TPA: type II toxin-antitoxin system HicA family toxin [Clostridium sp.]
MNWIIKFNQLEKENTDKVIDIIAKFDKYKNDMLDDVYTKAHNLKYLIDNFIDKLDVDVIMTDIMYEEAGNFFDSYNEIKDEFENVMHHVKDYIYVIGREIRELQYKMIEITEKYIRTNKEYDLLNKRIEIFGKKLFNISISLDTHSVNESCILGEIREVLNIMHKIIMAKLDKEIQDEYKLIEQLKQNQKKDYFKIFDYKEMVDLAEKHEYKQVRQSGDHIIMQHKKTNKIVPIPAHELKYGLMLQIQKQIQANKVS